MNVAQYCTSILLFWFGHGPSNCEITSRLLLFILKIKRLFFLFLYGHVTIDVKAKPFLMTWCLIVAVRIINNNQYKFDNFYNLSHLF